ncbi:hypothetical protein E2562_008569 [Oryza meyeriana var. granulata]|uniref:Uncharacterized protein n=1 Tax=Oryza meyeriana var. granulata TaxID=110450 RepID=A0A6G1C5C5_9ORYZ|nr:hypothetical protein E2562_008569 [Oryza meyeriana var. granulata]
MDVPRLPVGGTVPRAVDFAPTPAPCSLRCARERTAICHPTREHFRPSLLRGNPSSRSNKAPWSSMEAAAPRRRRISLGNRAPSYRRYTATTPGLLGPGRAALCAARLLCAAATHMRHSEAASPPACRGRQPHAGVRRRSTGTVQTPPSPWLRLHACATPRLAVRAVESGLVPCGRATVTVAEPCNR